MYRLFPSLQGVIFMEVVFKTRAQILFTSSCSFVSLLVTDSSFLTPNAFCLILQQFVFSYLIFILFFMDFVSFSPDTFAKAIIETLISLLYITKN